jgi:methionine-R-sulfoxide reductase
MTQDEDEFKKKLTPLQYHVLREAGTEPPFTGKYWHEKTPGMYRCAACGAALFSSEAKFDSMTGWPSFTEPINPENVELREDLSHQMKRIEVRCKRCGSHLGHVFNDGPTELLDGQPASGRRFCVNSAALELEPKNKD